MIQAGNIVDGRYQIIKEIGKGGGGIVYLALHLSLKQQVVLKEIKNAASYSDPETLRNEVDILKRLKHPALPQVYDFLQIDGRVFTAMEYIPGYSLQEYIQAGQTFPQENILFWARQLAEILEYMHTRPQPVIHRDIKPSNIMLKPDGNICLIDFNISDDTATGYRISGYSKGFASPEQMEKGRLMEHRIPSGHIVIDERSDLYSLGAVLYYLLCGKIPEEPYVSLESMNCCIYPLAKIVDKCLRREKKERYQTASELLYALNHLEKTDTQYLKYAWIQRISIMFSLFLATAGICLILFGRTVIIENEYEQAYEECKTAIETHSDDIAVIINRVLMNRKWTGILKNHPEQEKVLHYQLGRYYSDVNYRNAVKAFDEALRIDNNSEIDDEEIYSEYIQCCLKSGHPDRAEAIIKKAKAAGISSGELMMLEGKVDFADGNYSAAARQFETIMQGDYGTGRREEAKTYYARACLELQDYENAQKALESKEEKETGDYLDLALIYERNEKWEKSKEALLEAAKKEPDNPRIFVRLGLLYYHKHDSNLARYYYDKATELKKDKEYSEEFQEEYEELQSLVK